MATPTVYTPERLIAPTKIPGDVIQGFYTSPSSGLGTQLKEIAITCPEGDNFHLDLYLIENGGYASTYNKLINNFLVSGQGSPFILEFDSLYLNPGDCIAGKNITGSGFNVYIQLSGVELA